MGIKKAIQILTILAAAILPAGIAKADQFTYTGNPYTFCAGIYTCPSTPLSVTFTTTLTGAALDNLSSLTDITSTVTDYSFTDTNNAITPANGSFGAFSIGTDANGNITQWSVYESAQTGSFAEGTEGRSLCGNVECFRMEPPIARPDCLHR